MTCFLPNSNSGKIGAAGFTVLELMVAASLSGMILLGILSTSLHMTRSGLRIDNYTEIDKQVRRAFDVLGRDLKQAVDITWHASNDITLTIPTSDTTMANVTYAWSATDGTFYRVAGSDSTVMNGRTILLRGIPAQAQGAAGLVFTRFGTDGTAATINETTRIITVTLSVARSARMLNTTTATGFSATFALRNKASF